MGSPSQRSRQRDAAQRPVGDLAGLLEEVSGQVIAEPLLLRALTHRSFAYENGGIPHNERQEFLGDAVLGLVVTDHLYREHPDLPEGQLAKLRASVVNSRALAKVARGLDLGSFVLLGKGEAATGGRDKDSILADTMEAVIGTVYLLGGSEPAAKLIHHILDPLLVEATELGAGLDWKTSLQEALAAADLTPPTYAVSAEGPDHDKVFTARVVVGGQDMGVGVGRNKKTAEQEAAQRAWALLRKGRGEPAVSDAPAEDA